MIPFTLKQLRILKTVAIEKNFTKAAEILYISQPSLSKQLKNLEENLNILLIDRKKHTFFLTKNGQIFLQYAERILALCEESYRIVLDLKNNDRDNLKIGTSNIIGTYLLPQIITLFSRKYSQISFKIEINSTKFISKEILNNKVDIGLIEGKITNVLIKKFSIEYFIEDKLYLIISNLHPFAKKKIITKNELYTLNFITLKSNSIVQKSINTDLIQNNIKLKQLKIVMQLNSIEAIKNTVSLGLGAAFVFSSTIDKELSLKTIKTIQVENIEITQKIFLIKDQNPKYPKLKSLNFFYSYLYNLKKRLKS